MSVTESTLAATTEASGVFAEAIGGIATIALTIIALAGTAPAFLLAIAAIVFAAALLIEGTSIVADYANMQSAEAGELHIGAGGLAAVFLAGLTGIILGVLALLGIHADVLVSAAVITFGSALLLNSSSMLNLYAVKAKTASGLLIGGAAGTAGVQALAGIAAAVLGILAVAGQASMSLNLVALLVLGASMLVTGNGMNNAMISVFNRMPARG